MDQLAFTPVASLTNRQDGWTPERQRDFIAVLAAIGLVRAAAAAVGKSAKSAYALRRRADAASFAAAWDRAVGLGALRVRSEAIERALHGTIQPVFYRGRQVGERRVHDDRLLIAALRALSPRYAGERERRG